MFDDDQDAESVNEALQIGYTRQVLPSLCETRWLARVDAVSTLLARFTPVHETLTQIAEAAGPASSDVQSYLLAMSNLRILSQQLSLNMC